MMPLTTMTGNLSAIQLPRYAQLLIVAAQLWPVQAWYAFELFAKLFFPFFFFGKIIIAILSAPLGWQSKVSCV